MGNKVTSCDEYGKIIINVERMKYIAGEQINGYINLSLIRPFPSTELFLIIEGKEKSKIVDSRTHTDSEGRTRTEYFTRKDKNIFYEHSFPIYNMMGNSYFPAGQYSFPFSFVLKDDLPGSFEYCWSAHGHHPYGKIKYKLKAGLRDRQSDAVVYDKLKLVIDEKLTHGSYNLMPKPFEKNVSGYCYTSHGNYKLAAIFSSDKYVVGDRAMMSLAVDATQAETDIKQIKAELVMTTSVLAQGHRNVHSTIVQSVCLPGVMKGFARMNENSIPVEMNIMTKGELQATASGDLVRNSFSLKIVGEVDGCVCYSENPNSSIPVAIYNKHFNTQPMPNMNNLIPNWQPQTYDPYVCEMNSNFRMTSDFKNNMMFNQGVEMPTG